MSNFIKYYRLKSSESKLATHRADFMDCSGEGYVIAFSSYQCEFIQRFEEKGCYDTPKFDKFIEENGYEELEDLAFPKKRKPTDEVKLPLVGKRYRRKAELDPYEIKIIGFFRTWNVVVDNPEFNIPKTYDFEEFFQRYEELPNQEEEPKREERSNSTEEPLVWKVKPAIFGRAVGSSLADKINEGKMKLPEIGRRYKHQDCDCCDIFVEKIEIEESGTWIVRKSFFDNAPFNIIDLECFWNSYELWVFKFCSDEVPILSANEEPTANKNPVISKNEGEMKLNEDNKTSSTHIQDRCNIEPIDDVEAVKSTVKENGTVEKAKEELRDCLKHGIWKYCSRVKREHEHKELINKIKNLLNALDADDTNVATKGKSIDNAGSKAPNKSGDCGIEEDAKTLIMGVDIGKGRDKTIYSLRKGHEILYCGEKNPFVHGIKIGCLVTFKKTAGIDLLHDRKMISLMDIYGLNYQETKKLTKITI